MSRIADNTTSDYLVAPNISGHGLTRAISTMDHEGLSGEIAVVEERPLTIFLNSTEILTAMTIGDFPEYLALGFLFNQRMLTRMDDVSGVEFDEESDAVVVRTKATTAHENKLGRRVRTSGCAVGTVFGDLYDSISELRLPQAEIRASWLYQLAHVINRTPSLYLEAGAIHGTVLCRRDKPLVYMEDVGRHNAVDKIAGWMLSEGVGGSDKLLYTTGRLTSEMILKTASMGIPGLVSRSGFTAWGVEIANRIGLTLVGRLRGKRFVCVSGHERLIYDADPRNVPVEDRRHQRKSAGDD